MRLFFALWPPAQAARGLHAWAQKAARETRGRVTRAETIHLTLAFLGEVDEEALPSAIGAGRGTGGKAHTLPIEQARWWKHNRIVWAGPNETPAPLASLAVELKRNLLEAGFELEQRPCPAPVTLFRKACEPGGRPPLPAGERFAAAVARAGIGPGVLVVAYGSLGGAERLWWLLRHFGHDDCAVLIGGLDAWGGPLRAGEEAIEEAERRGLVKVADDGADLLVSFVHPLFGEVIRRRLGRASARRLRGWSWRRNGAPRGPSISPPFRRPRIEPR